MERVKTKTIRNLAIGLGVLLAMTIVALVVTVKHKVNNVPDVARNVAARVAHEVAQDQAHVQAVKSTADALRASSLKACYRSNQLRDTLNLQDSHIYAAFATVAALEHATANTKPSGKIVNQGAYHRRLQIEEQAAKAIPDAADNMQYLPPTDCGLAFKQGSSYRPPPAISWAEHLKQSKRGH